jgi:two-component system alkaline phosphatase synthesis response regulator PhoP
MTIDTEQYRVSLDSKPIEMPRKEFELLLLLASKPGKVFTREAILDSVWGTDVVVGGRTIDVHIRKLREKIGDSKIGTIKGVGYKFEG